MDVNDLKLMQCINDLFTHNVNLLLQVNDSNELLLYCTFRNQRHRMQGFCEEWLPHYIEHDFFPLFRMTPTTLHILLTEIRCAELDKVYSGGEQPISGEKMLMMTLWWLGKGEVLLSVSDKFNVTLSAVHKSTEIVLSKLVLLKNKYIQWPYEEELVQIEVDFRERSGYPGVIGAIDGCNIPIKAPLAHQESYIDRKLQHSIKLQGTCTAKKIFTNILVGFPGSVHDSRVFRCNLEIATHFFL